MGLRVAGNVASTNTQGRHSHPRRRLSTGLHVSTAEDDGCLAVSERLRAQIRSLEQRLPHASDGASLVQTAESALDEIGSILTPLGELVIGNPGVAALDDEFQSRIVEIDRMGRGAEFRRAADIDEAIHTLLITDEYPNTCESPIRDAGVAIETARRTRDSIRRHAGAAVLSQANALPQSAVRLLG
ncbi:MAG TPA: flagellin [Planctomycetota bacterium]